MCPAIHINSRSWLRSSSTHEPSDPPLRVVSLRQYGEVKGLRAAARNRRGQSPGERKPNPKPFNDSSENETGIGAVVRDAEDRHRSEWKTSSPGSWGKGLESMRPSHDSLSLAWHWKGPPAHPFHRSLPAANSGDREQAPRRGSRIHDRQKASYHRQANPGGTDKPLATHEGIRRHLARRRTPTGTTARPARRRPRSRDFRDRFV